VLLRVKDAKNLKAIEHAVLKEISALASGRVDAKRMEAVRSNLKYSTIMSLDNADAVAVTEAVATALTDDVEFLNQEFDEIGKVKPADLPTFAKKYLLDANRTTVTLTTAAQGGAQ
jgi:zinc protease